MVLRDKLSQLFFSALHMLSVKTLSSIRKYNIDHLGGTWRSLRLPTWKPLECLQLQTLKCMPFQVSSDRVL